MNTEHIKSISLYAVSLFLIKGVSLFTLPLMAHYLSPSQIGHLELLGVTTVFFSLIVGLAMHENLYRFIGTVSSKVVRKRKASQLYSATLLLSMSLSALLLIGYYLMPFKADSLTHEQVLFMALVLCYEAPLAISLAWLRLHNLAGLFFKVCVSTVIAQVSLLIIALIHKPDVTVIFALNVICTFVQFLFLHIYINFPLMLPNKQRMKRYIRYSAPLMLSGVVAFGLSGAERWLIAGATNLETLGMYAIAAKFALAVGILIQPFHMWWMPKRFEAMDNKGPHYVANVTTQGVVLLSIISVTVAWLSQIFITIALPESYQPAIALVGMTITMMLFKELVELTNFGILYKKNTTQLLYINVTSTVLAFIVCFASIASGIEAILWGLIAGQLSRFALTIWFSQQAHYLGYPSSNIFALLTLTALFLLTSRYHQSIEVSALMLLLQPLGVVAFAIRFKLISGVSLKSLTHTVNSYLGKSL
ncbi:lipopolysaccharide biosynthesis protein [Vibrio europaeus]|uniref:lipopolysaccharide biosynthesis protein n=1 Tax=Vibrio europaeus TaxID=300876 RepID=UPI00148C659F|nr:oligosaccharide flippase family protein [Vibrio europaeus]NOH24806.1 oligosaccharide flippase family protein [Vibrio europaeus]